MKEVFVKAKLVRDADRIDNCKVAIKHIGGGETEVECSVYTIYNEKPNTEKILQMLEYECNNMISDTHNYQEKVLIAQIYDKFVEVIKLYQ